jgi:phage tail-like protein
MPNPAFETVDPPYTAFRFEVVINLPASVSGITSPVCNAAFAECDGLEMSLEPKTVQEGGYNLKQTHLIGPVRYGQLTLRRGMTDNLDLWKWFLAAAQPGRVTTAHIQVTLWDASGQPRVTFDLQECLPIKMRGPSLNAKDGQVAVEEMQLVYERMSIKLPGEAGVGLSAGFGASVSASAGISVSASAGASVSASAEVGVSASASFGASAGASFGL